MRRSRHIIAIVVLASALAADGPVLAASATQSPAAAGTFAGTLTGTLAGRLVQRISVALRRTIRTPYWKSNDSTCATREITRQPIDAMISPVGLSPFQHRLPPPAV